MASHSIADELLSCVSPYSYSERISCLTTDDFIVLKQFPNAYLGQLFKIDWSGCKNNGEINNMHLLEIFGSFSDEEPESVRSDAIECIESGSPVYEHVGEEFFEMLGISFREWALTVCNDYYYGDELFVYALCRIFHRHAMIVCYDRVWTTINPQHTLSINELLDVCDLHLVFLRLGIYSELKLKKQNGCLPPLTTDPSSPEFPAWSENDSQMLSLPNLKGSVDSDLLKQYLNIKEEPDAPAGLLALSSGNTSPKDVVQTIIASADSYQMNTIVTSITKDYLVSNVETDGTQIADTPMSTEEVISLTTSNPVTLKHFVYKELMHLLLIPNQKSLWNIALTLCHGMINSSTHAVCNCHVP